MYLRRVNSKKTEHAFLHQCFWGHSTTTSSSGQLWTFYMIPTLCHMTKRGLSSDSLSPSSCPRSNWMTPCGLWRAQQTLLHTFHISFCQHVIESVNVFFDSPCTEFMALKWFILKIWPTFAKIEKMNINDLEHFSIIMVFESTYVR